MAKHMLNAVRDSNYDPESPSIAESARRNGVPRSTLSHRFQGRPSRKNAHQKQQLLSEEEEKALVKALE